MNFFFVKILACRILKIQPLSVAKIVPDSSFNFWYQGLIKSPQWTYKHLPEENMRIWFLRLILIMYKKILK